MSTITLSKLAVEGGAHVAGVPCEMDAIVRLANSRGLPWSGASAPTKLELPNITATGHACLMRPRHEGWTEGEVADLVEAPARVEGAYRR